MSFNRHYFKIRTFLFLIFFLPGIIKAQTKWIYNGQVNFGASVNFYHGPGQHYPGYKLYAGFNICGTYKEHILANYGTAICIYNKSLGNNLNPLIRDLEIDFINSFSGGTGTNELSYTKYFRTFNSSPYYNIGIKNAYAVLLTSNYIINNHHRNQAVGTINASFPGLTLTYANDGAVPIGTLGLGDSFDRWWTGSGALFFHGKENYNNAEFTFDQFTGYSPLLYELSGLLGINVPTYKLNDTGISTNDDIEPPTFNSSAYQLTVFPTQGYGINAGVIGSLRSKKGRIWGFQDLIHRTLGYALHPNHDVNRLFFGVTQNNMYDVKP